MVVLGRHKSMAKTKIRNAAEIDRQVSSERGSALIYILIAIALMGALTMTFMEPSSQQTTSQSGFRTVTEITGQVDAIRTAIQECALSYPKGDRTVDVTASGTDPYARRNFPLAPDSAHFNGAAIPDASDRYVRHVRCPGNPIGAVNNHSPIFAGVGGKFLPPPPELFGEWEYYNGQDGIFIWVKTSKTDAFINTALTKLDDQFSECEADIVNASAGAINLDSGSPAEVQCEAGETCFRVRLTINNATAVWNGDDENDESACP
jgi:hypothetical protein